MPLFQSLIYSGQVKLTDAVSNSPIDAGQVLSPTRTYAPIIKKILDKYTSNEVHGMVHGGGAQNFTFCKNLHIIKIIYFPTLVSVNSGAIKTDWKRCIKFLTAVIAWNCTFEAVAQDIIAISKSFNVDAQIVGRVEAATAKKIDYNKRVRHFEYNFSELFRYTLQSLCHPIVIGTA
jgi:phosphoribosylformylglycinamidine cyclo-ligase